MLELNDVLISGEKNTLSVMAPEGRLTCLSDAAGTPGTARRCLQAVMGFVPVEAGFISIDGEPLTPESAPTMRRLLLSFAPSRLPLVGEVDVMAAPKAREVFALYANRRLNLDNDGLQREMQRMGCSGPQARLLAVAALLQRPILLVDNPLPAFEPYLLQLASQGRTVVVASENACYNRYTT